MTTTASERSKKQRRKYLDSTGAPLPGVTTIMGAHLGWSRHALMAWAARTTAEACQRGAADPARAYLKTRDEAAKVGQVAHEMIEIEIAGGDPMTADGTPLELDLAKQSLEKFRRWRETSGMQVIASEVALVDGEFGYGGTLDLVCQDVTGMRYIVDVKTGKSVYDETIIQLGAYTSLWNRNDPEHPIHSGMILHLPIEGHTRVVPVTLLQLTEGAKAFACLLTIHKMRNSLKLEKAPKEDKDGDN